MKRLLLALLLTLPAIAQAPNPAWQKLAFLTGKWTGIAENAQGDFSFLPDLDSHVLIRRSQDTAVFEAPQFRLTYHLEKGVLQGKFEVGGKLYLNWSARRQ